MDEQKEAKKHSVASTETNSFEEIKKQASENIGQMLQDLRAFEIAIKFEKIPEIYRIYNGRLHEELDRTSNQSHEIDRLLAQKLHNSFMERFPFMIHSEKISETMNYYRISDYYRDRPVIGIDSGIPEIFVIPKIDQEWQRFMRRADGVLPNEEINGAENQINQLEAKAIAAKSEIAKIDDQLRELKNQEAAIENTKGFFNRGKVDEELEPLFKRRQELEEEREKWQPFIEDRHLTDKSRKQIEEQIKDLRLQRAVVEKERRLLEKYFGGTAEMAEQLQSFLTEYLNLQEEVAEID